MGSSPGISDASSTPGETSLVVKAFIGSRWRIELLGRCSVFLKCFLLFGCALEGGSFFLFQQVGAVFFGFRWLWLKQSFGALRGAQEQQKIRWKILSAAKSKTQRCKSLEVLQVYRKHRHTHMHHCIMSSWQD